MDKEKLLKLAQQTDVASALKVMEKLGRFQAKESLEKNMIFSKLAEEVGAGNIPPEILGLLAEEGEEEEGSAEALAAIQEAVLDQADETPSLVPDDVALDIVSGAAGSTGEEADEEAGETDLAEAIAEIMAEGEEEEEEAELTEDDLKTASLLLQLGIV